MNSVGVKFRRTVRRCSRLAWQITRGGRVTRSQIRFRLFRRLRPGNQSRDVRTDTPPLGPRSIRVSAPLSSLIRFASEIRGNLGSQLEIAHSERRRLTNLGREAFLDGEYEEFTRVRARIEDLKAELRSSLTGEVGSYRVLDSEWTGPMGNLALIDQYIKMLRLGQLDAQAAVLLGDPRSTANPQLFELWSHQLPTARTGGALLGWLEYQLWPISEQVEVRTSREGILDHYRWLEIADVRWSEQQRSPVLQLDESTTKRGMQVLNKWGLSEDDWFVAVHVRDAWTPAREVANADVDTYINSFRAIVDQGGWVIRMGVPGSKPIPKMPRVIDYTQAITRAPWMDVFLWACCRFFVGTASGPLSVPNAFGRPTLATNTPSLGLSFSFPRGFEVPKLIRRNGSNGGAMSLRESLLHRAAWTASSRVLGHDVVLVDCHQEHLEVAVRDMLNPDGGDQVVAAKLSRRADEIRRECGARGATPFSPSFLAAVLRDHPTFLN